MMIGDPPSNPDETIPPPTTAVIKRGEALLAIGQAFHRLVNAITEAEQVAVAIARQLDAQAKKEGMT